MLLDEIADAIRFRKKTTAPIPAGAFPSWIRSIVDPTTIVTNTYADLPTFFTSIATAIRAAGRTTALIKGSDLPDAIYHIMVWNGTMTVDTPPFNGTGTASDPWLIENPQQFAYFSKLVTDDDPVYNALGVHYKLMHDMWFNRTDDYANWATKPPKHIWKPVGMIASSFPTGFGGNFDGNNKTVGGFYIPEGLAAGVFARFHSQSATLPCGLKDLTVNESWMKVRMMSGGVMGICHRELESGTPGIEATTVYVENCHFDGYFEGADSNCGGLIGSASGCRVENCTVRGTVKSTRDVGGIVGSLSLGDLINCENHATVESVEVGTGISATYTSKDAGGIVGTMQGTSMVPTVTTPPPGARIINCRNYGSVRARESAGGLTAMSFYLKNRIENSTNYGDVTAWGDNATSGGKAAGVIAIVQPYGINTTPPTGYPIDVELHDCANYGKISSAGSQVGGLVAFTGWHTMTADTKKILRIYNCYNMGDVTSDLDNVGGLIGAAHAWSPNDNWFDMINCYNRGNVSGRNQVGGLCGDHTAIDPRIVRTPPIRTWIFNCYSSGRVTGGAGQNQVGGLFGSYSVMAMTPEPHPMTVAECYFLRTGTMNAGMEPIGGEVPTGPQWSAVIPHQAPTTPATQWTAISGTGPTATWEKVTGGTSGSIWLAYGLGNLANTTRLELTGLVTWASSGPRLHFRRGAAATTTGQQSVSGSILNGTPFTINPTVNTTAADNTGPLFLSVRFATNGDSLTSTGTFRFDTMRRQDARVPIPTTNIYSFNNSGIFNETLVNGLLPFLTNWRNANTPYQAAETHLGISAPVPLKDWQTAVWPEFVP